MKRLLVLLLCLLGCGFFVFRLPPVSITGPHLLALVPRESLCVVELRHPRQMCDSMANTPLGKRMARVPWAQLAHGAGYDLPKGQVDPVHQLWAMLSVAQTMLKAPDSLVQDTGVIALVPPDAGQAHSGPVTGNPLLLGRMHDRHGFSRLVAFLARSRQLQPAGHDRILGFPIVQYQIPGHGVVYLGHYRDVLLLSPVKAVLRQAITLAGADVGINRHCIFGERFFVRGRRIDNRVPQLTVYINVQAVERLTGATPEQMGLASVLSGLTGKGLERILLSWDQQHTLHHITSLCRLQQKDLPALVRLCSLRTPVQNRELARVPSGITTYFWSNWFSPAAWWQAYLASTKQHPGQYGKMVNTVLHKYLHLSAAELTALFEYDWSVFVTEIKQSAFVPVPRFCFRLGMINPERLALLLQKNIAELPHRLDIVSSTKVTSLIMAGGLMEPSYSFINNDLWLFDGYDQVREMLQPGPDRLVDNADFRQVAGKTDRPVNLQLFVRMPPVIRGLRDLFSWLDNAMPTTDASRTQNHFLSDQMMEPLLESLDGIESVFVSASMQPDELETHVRLLAGRGHQRGKKKDE